VDQGILLILLFYLGSKRKDIKDKNSIRIAYDINKKIHIQKFHIYIKKTARPRYF
jgi:hypothetical protein